MSTRACDADLSSAAVASTLWRRNRQTLVRDFRQARTDCRGMPTHMKIELTNFCNLACPMCPHPQMQRAVGTMRPALFRKIIDEAAPYLEFAYLHHLGESLVVRRIGELIAYGRSRGVAMGLSTNATFLDADKSRALLENGLDFLVISLDAASAATYQQVRVGGDFATTLANTQQFFSLKRQIANHTTVVVQMIVMDSNRHEIEAFARTWEGHVMIKEVRDWAGQVPLRIGKNSTRIEHSSAEHTHVEHSQVDGSRSKAARSDPSRVDHSGVESSRVDQASAEPARVGTSRVMSSALGQGLPPCRMPWSEITVLWDGTVVPCANHFEKINVLGNLRTHSLAEVWNGAAMQSLRRAHLHNQVSSVPVCASCSRHALDADDFVAVDQLTQRLRSYVRSDLTPRPGLS